MDNGLEKKDELITSDKEYKFVKEKIDKIISILEADIEETVERQPELGEMPSTNDIICYKLDEILDITENKRIGVLVEECRFIAKRLSIIWLHRVRNKLYKEIEKMEREDGK